MDAVQARVQKSVNGMLTTLDRDHLRRLQSDMYKCGVHCCDNTSYSMEEVHRCIDRCSASVTKAQNIIQNELQAFQDRLQRCALDCQDKARDKLTANTSEAEMSKCKGELETCVVKCSDTHIELIPSLLKRIRENLTIAAKDK